MNTQIILIKVSNTNARRVCELMEDELFENYEHLKTYIESFSIDSFAYYRLTSFMDEVNDGLMENLEDYFMSYVRIKNI